MLTFEMLNCKERIKNALRRAGYATPTEAIHADADALHDVAGMTPALLVEFYDAILATMAPIEPDDIIEPLEPDDDGGEWFSAEYGDTEADTVYTAVTL